MADASAVAPPRARGILAVGLVFALGAVFGAALCFVLLRLGPGGPPPPGMREDRMDRADRMPIARMVRDLDLDARQQKEIQEILERSHAEVRGILERSREEIRDLLRPDQKEKLDRLRPPEGSPFPRGRGREPRED